MPFPRIRKTAVRPLDITKSNLAQLSLLDTPKQTHTMEAAWDDGSDLDQSSPPIEHSEKLAGLAYSLRRDSVKAVEDRFEVDALRRQVEQLQMALQLQRHQLAVAETRQHLRVARSTSQLQRETVPAQPFPLLPAIPTQWSPGRAGALARPTRSSLRPAYSPSTVATSILSHGSDSPLAAEEASGFDLNRGHFRPIPAHPYIHRPQSEFSLVSTPSLSPTQTTTDEQKLDDLNRKVQALEQLFASMSPPPAPLVAASASVSDLRGDSSTTSHRSAFEYNTTPASRSTVTLSSNPPPPTKTSKLASVFKSRTAPALSAPEAAAGINWRRKKTDNLELPKVKVRQGPGRGRMVIRQAAAS